MSRKRYVYDPNATDQWGGKGAIVEVLSDASLPQLHYVRPDTPGYTSPITGQWVDGARARRDDLARNNCRPYEGFAAEKQHALAIREGIERKQEARLEADVRRAWYQLPPRKRRHLEG